MREMTPALHLVVDHGSVPLGDVVLPTVLVGAGIASLTIVGLAVVAFTRRRSRSYLLIAMALGTLLARTLAGGLAMNGVVGVEFHHLVEHALDGVMAVLLLAAVYFARTVERPADGDLT